MKYLSLLIVFFIAHSVLYIANAQNPEIDSLENLLQKHVKKDTVRINLLNETAYKIYRINIEKTLKYAQEARNLSQDLNYKKGEAKSLRLIGIYYDSKSDYSSAIDYFRKSLKLFQELGNKSGISYSINSIGLAYMYQGDYPKALEYLQKSLKIKEELSDKRGISLSYHNIGVIYTKEKDYPKALEYFQKSLKIKEELGDKIGISNSCIGIGFIYLYQGDYPKAMEYFQKSLQISVEIGSKSGISSCYNYIGEVYKTQGDYSKALKYYQKSLKINVETGRKESEALSYKELGSLYFKQKKTKEAYNFSKKAYMMAEEIGDAELIMGSAEILAKSSEALGLYKEAYSYHVIFKVMNDSLYNEENIKKITGLEYQYKYEKEKQTIEHEQQKKDAIYAEKAKRQKMVTLAFILGFILMTSLALAVLLYFMQKRKANKLLTLQKKQIEETNEELIKQNEEIQTFAYDLEKANKTKDKFFSIIAHDLKGPFSVVLGFSDILLENHKEYDDLERETYIRYIKDSSDKTYKLLENLLTWAKSQTGRIEFTPEKINIEELITDIILLLEEPAKNKEIKLISNTENNLTVNVDENMINTIIRNLVSNAIKFTPKGGNITIKSHTTTDENSQQFVEIIVKDSGIGIPPEVQSELFKISTNISTKGTDNEDGTGLGLILCKEFVEKHGGEIWVESEVGKGSEFIFTIPLSN